MEPGEFKKSVLNLVKQIPFGKVLSYGDVAQLVDSPRAARQVGWILGGLGLDTEIPWWRVVNKQGYLSIRGHEFDAKEVQSEKLRGEGVEVDDSYNLNMEKYRWSKKLPVASYQ